MKIHQHTSLALIALSISLLAVACEEEPEGPGDPVAGIAFFHGAHDTGPLDLQIDDNAIVSGSAFQDFSEYVEVEPGAKTLAIANAGSASTEVELVTNIRDGESYTVVATSDTTGELDLLLFKDDLAAPQAGTALFRMMHLMSNGPKLRFAFKGTGGGPLYDSTAYKQITESFNATEPDTYTARFMDHSLKGKNPANPGGDTVAAVIERDVTLLEGKIYTLAVTGTVSEPSFKLIQHN